MNDSQVAQWLHDFFNGSISPEQKEKLADWIQEHGHTEQFETLMQQSWTGFEPGATVPNDKAREWLQTITPVVAMKRRWYWLAAAIVLVLLGAGILYRLLPTKQTLPKAPVAIVQPNDIAPPANSTAVLTLANGQRIVLDSAANGQLATGIIKVEDGKIAYENTMSTGALQYNTLTVPAGSRIASITLSDGTGVTLNAASSITYPVAFDKVARKVTITGEVYFEVSKSKTPFVVDVDGKTNVEVLGTHFNINAYDDDVKTTLLEGSVKMGNKVLKPGEQALLNGAINKEVDIQQTMAWKNGLFIYKGTDIKSIMRDVARTYGLTIHYESNPDEKFYAEVPRNTNVSNLLKILELTGEVHFKIAGNQVTVLK